MDMSDAVADLDNCSNIIHIKVYVIVLNLVFDDGCYFFRIHFHNFAVTPVSSLIRQ